MTELLLTGLIFIAAVLYSSVGHGGASGYLAAMALFNLSPTVMKPSALILNIIVSTIASFHFYRAGGFNRTLFLSVATSSIPCAFIGGMLILPARIYQPLIGVVLLYAAVRLLWQPSPALTSQTARLPSGGMLLLLGGAIGLLSGLTGVGGGIFLSPLLLLMGWATPLQTAGVSAAFILVNSIAGLGGYLTKFSSLPPTIGLWAIAVVIGGWLGANYGSKQIDTRRWQQILAVVLIVAGLKSIALVFTHR